MKLKKIICFVFIICQIFTISACNRKINQEKSSQQEKNLLDDIYEDDLPDKCIEITLECLTKNDKETFKSIVADSIIKANSDIDERIDEIFEFFDGKIIHHEKYGVTIEKSKLDKFILTNIVFGLKVTTDSDTYIIRYKYKMCSKYFSNKLISEKSGLYLFEIASETDMNNSGKTNFFKDIEGLYVIKIE